MEFEPTPYGCTLTLTLTFNLSNPNHAISKISQGHSILYQV